MRSRRSSVCSLLLIAVLGVPATARADEPDAAATTEARQEFVKGTDLAKKAQWAEALGAFERSSKLRPHPVTTYNVGVCHRAMGSYTLARESFARALEQNEAAGGAELPPALASDNKALLAEIDRLLAKAHVTLSPPNAAVAVDGRPLAKRAGQEMLLVAGTRDPGPGEAPPSGTFDVLLNPGVHVFTIERQGFADAVVNRTLAPGGTVDLRLELDRLPATLHIAATEPGAVVSVDDLDVGVAPVDVSRPAGTYHVVVRKPGFKRYDAQVAVQPGQKADLRASLAKDEVSVTRRWWFWTAAGVVVAGVAASTYALTRGETTRQEPLDGGGLGWTVRAR